MKDRSEKGNVDARMIIKRIAKKYVWKWRFGSS